MRELSIIFFCTWKFAATFPVAIYLMKMTVAETLIYTNTGGILGAVIFLNFSNFLLMLWHKYSPVRKTRRKIFTPASRKFVKIKIKYGLPGIVILSPVILSIPVGAFLAAKYYGNSIKVLIWLISGQVFWSLVFTFFYMQVKTIIA